VRAVELECGAVEGCGGAGVVAGIGEEAASPWRT